MTRLALIAACVVVAAIGIFAISGLMRGGPEQGQVTSSGRALVGGPFSLVSHTGERITDESFAGRYMLIYFGFTYCPDVCPMELTKMTQALEILGSDAEDVAPILITVDPARDTPEVLASYLNHFDSRFVGLTGTEDEIRTAADAYRVYYKRAEAEGSAAEYLMDHSSIVYFMDKSGEFLAHFTPDTSPEQMAETLARYL